MRKGAAAKGGNVIILLFDSKAGEIQTEGHITERDQPINGALHSTCHIDDVEQEPVLLLPQDHFVQARFVRYYHRAGIQAAEAAQKPAIVQDVADILGGLTVVTADVIGHALAVGVLGNSGIALLGKAGIGAFHGDTSFHQHLDIFLHLPTGVENGCGDPMEGEVSKKGILLQAEQVTVANVLGPIDPGKTPEAKYVRQAAAVLKGEVLRHVAVSPSPGEDKDDRCCPR